MEISSGAVAGSDRGQGTSGHRAAEARPTLHGLTGLRFLAALVVFVSHFPELIPVDGLQRGLDEQGAAGVTIFFVLSGFVMTYNYGATFASSTRGAGAYMRARLARIVPMATAALLLTTPVVLAVADSPPSALSWVVNVLQLHALVPAHSMHLWNIPSWSISAELCFYLFFPLFVAVVLRRARRHPLALAGGMYAVAVASYAVVAVVLEDRLLASGKDPVDIALMLERVKFFPGLRIWEFFIGCVLGSMFVLARRPRAVAALDRRPVRNACLAVAAVAMVGVLLVASDVERGATGLGSHLASSGLYLTYTPLAVLIVAAVAWGPSLLTPVVEHRWVRRMGDASLSFYLLQWPLALLAADLTTARWAGLVVLPILVVVSLLGHRWIEVPARGRLRGRPVPTTATAPVPT